MTLYGLEQLATRERNCDTIVPAELMLPAHSPSDWDREGEPTVSEYCAHMDHQKISAKIMVMGIIYSRKKS